MNRLVPGTSLNNWASLEVSSDKLGFFQSISIYEMYAQLIFIPTLITEVPSFWNTGLQAAGSEDRNLCLQGYFPTPTETDSKMSCSTAAEHPARHWTAHSHLYLACRKRKARTLSQSSRSFLIWGLQKACSGTANPAAQHVPCWQLRGGHFSLHGFARASYGAQEGPPLVGLCRGFGKRAEKTSAAESGIDLSD